MANKKDTFVVQHPEGWAVRKPNAQRATLVVRTQNEAVDHAKKATAKKGSVHVQGKNGKFRAQ